MTHKLKGMRVVEQHVHYVNKRRQNVGLEKWLWLFKLWRHKQRTPNTNDLHMPLNEPPHENFLRAPLCEALGQANPLVRPPLPLLRKKNGKASVKLGNAENDNIDTLNQWFSTFGRDLLGSRLPFFNGSSELQIKIFIITSMFCISFWNHFLS